MATVMEAQVGRALAAPLRDGLDRRGVNRNLCLGVMFVVLGAVAFVAFSFLVKCYDTPVACVAALGDTQQSRDSVRCNCGTMKWALGGGVGGTGLLLIVYERLTGEGAAEMRRTREQSEVDVKFLAAPE